MRTSNCHVSGLEIEERVHKGVYYREIPDTLWYFCGEDGSVWRGDITGDPKEWKRLKTHCNRGSAVLRVWLTLDGTQYSRRVGELVLRAFDQPAPTPGLYVQYHDGNPKNVRIENLYWDERRIIDRPLWERFVPFTWCGW